MHIVLLRRSCSLFLRRAAPSRQFIHNVARVRPYLEPEAGTLYSLICNLVHPSINRADPRFMNADDNLTTPSLGTAPHEWHYADLYGFGPQSTRLRLLRARAPLVAFKFVGEFTCDDGRAKGQPPGHDGCDDKGNYTCQRG